MVAQALKATLSRTERAILRCLNGQGGFSADGHEAIALAIDSGLRSVQRSVHGMSQRGLLIVRRHGRRPAEIRLTTAGFTTIRALLPQAKAHTPIGVYADSTTTTASVRSQPPTAPRGFLGDATALASARIAAKIRHSESPSDLAELYLREISNTEEARLLSFLDEAGTLPSSLAPTGLAILDDGLRAHFAARSLRARHAARVRWATTGVKVLRGDDEE